jgi:hypothetical protein
MKAMFNLLNIAKGSLAAPFCLILLLRGGISTHSGLDDVQHLHGLIS